LNIIENENNEMILQYFDSFASSVMSAYTSIEYEQFNSLSYRNADFIAKDTVSGENLTVTELSNKKLLIPYKEGGKEIIFYGQYNENNCWDGTCIFNIYEYDEDFNDNILCSILEAEYKDGYLVSYRKITKETTFQEKNVWSVSDRVIETKNNGDKYTYGETWNYFRVNEFKQNFDFDSVKNNNIILYIDDFKSNLETFSILEGYYCGETANGYYNDSTGNAYMVKYAEDGTIRAIYVGVFKDGFIDDNTGNSWEIVFDGSNNINRYFYYQGIFERGYRKSDNGIRYIEQDEINDKIKGMSFNCELNWYNKNDNENI
ncbi:MAG: hypothetical protein K2N85_00255, partial [Lachnospiraceae bacterium]|nr:hypothetical protein [Lachnospiraceae bacterium]